MFATLARLFETPEDRAREALFAELDAIDSQRRREWSKNQLFWCGVQITWRDKLGYIPRFLTEYDPCRDESCFHFTGRAAKQLPNAEIPFGPWFKPDETDDRSRLTIRTNGFQPIFTEDELNDLTRHIERGIEQLKNNPEKRQHTPYVIVAPNRLNFRKKEAWRSHATPRTL